MCIVVWYRDNQRNETLIATPATNAMLYNNMLMKHRVGASEIRAVKAVEANDLAHSMMRV